MRSYRAEFTTKKVGDKMENKSVKKLQSAIEPLKVYHNYFADYDELKAKSLLMNFYSELKDIAPESQVILRRKRYYSFYINLFLVMQALENKEYSKACHEICTLDYYESILQMRVYNSLMLLLQKYLE